jgi:hypothetical protein
VFDGANAAKWPHLDRRTVTIGGITVTCAEALRACDVLLSNGACAIKAVLAAAGSPLAECDYHAVYRPGWAAAKAALDRTGRPGAAGRHLAKHAFAAAVRAQVTQAACDSVRDALDAFSRDERYAALIAQDANALSGHRPARAAA